MDGAAFVRETMSRLGVETASELAEKMRWRRGMERTVARWLSGESKPSFDYAMEMGEKAGFFSRSEGVQSAESLRSLREEGEVTNVDLLDNQVAAMRILEKLNDSLPEIREALGLPEEVDSVEHKQAR